MPPPSPRSPPSPPPVAPGPAGSAGSASTGWRRALRTTLGIALALALLFGEWGWVPLSRSMARLGRRWGWTRVEHAVGRLPPWAALAALASPMLLLLPVKLLALYLFGIGRVGVGLALLVAAKLAGTALVARLFVLVLPALMQLRWFAYGYPRWKGWKDRLLDSVRLTPGWRRWARWRLRLRRRTAIRVRRWLQRAARWMQQPGTTL